MAESSPDQETSQERQLKSEKSTDLEQLLKLEASTDTEVNVWHIPSVIQQLRALQDTVDKDELRAGCYQESLITPAQRNHLAAIPTNRQHNEKLVQFLEAGNVFSFNGFIKVLKKNLPRALQYHHRHLSQAALADVDRIPHTEQVQCLVRVKGGENGAPAELEIDKAAVEDLELRYLFASPYVDNVEAISVNAMGDEQDTGLAQASGVQSNTEWRESRNGVKSQDRSFQILLDAWLTDNSAVDKESRIWDERLSRRIVLLAGDFHVIVKDLHSKDVATQKSLDELTTNAEESGIYCLTPADKTKPIYMIIKLKHQTAHFHTRILRLALEMSRHLVVYYGETKLRAGGCFDTSEDAQDLDMEASAEAMTVHGRDLTSQRPRELKLVFDKQSVDVLQILHRVLADYPLKSRIDLSRRSVHLHCVLDVPSAAPGHVLQLQCGDYCKKLFGINPLEKCSGELGYEHIQLEDIPLLLLEDPTIDFVPTFNVTEAHCFNSDWEKALSGENRGIQLHPWVDQMWLYSVCGLMPRPLLTCIVVGDQYILATVDGRTQMDRHGRMFSESSNTDVVLHINQHWQGRLGRINFGLLERVLLSWKGAVQITTVLAGKDDKWSQEFLHDLAGLPFVSSTVGQRGEPSVMVAWRFNQARNVLWLFLVFSGPVPAVAPAGPTSFGNPDKPSTPSQLDEACQMSRLVYAATAMSNICILPDSSAKDGTQSMLQMYLKCLNSVVGEHLRLYEDVKESREKEVLSGTLLVSGEHGDDTAARKELTDRYLCHVVYLDQQSLESATEELLSSHSKQHIYASGPKCLNILKLIVFSINEENFNNLSLQDLYLTECKSVIRKLNKVARNGNPASGSRDKSVSQGKELAFTVEVGFKFAFSVSGYETMSDEDFMKVERGLPKQRRQHAGHQDATVRVDLRKSQLEYHRELVRKLNKPALATDTLCQAVLAKHSLEMDERIEVVKEWVKLNINGRKLGDIFCATIVAECHHYIRGMEESKQLCLKPCSYNCDYPCLLPAGHPPPLGTKGKDDGPGGDLASGGASADSADSTTLAPEYAPRKHDCLLCDPRDGDEWQDKCDHVCELCKIDRNEGEMDCMKGESDDRKDQCCFKPGHQLDGNDGENIHLCMARDDLHRNGKHRCKQLCAMAKARGCAQKCQELKMIPRAVSEMSHDTCDCGIGKEKHLCDKQCNLCGKQCERLCEHPESEAHNCGNIHNCPYHCEEEGVCCVDRNMPGPKSKLVRQELRNSNGWNRPCKRIIPAWQPTHVGLPHSCVESGRKSIHTCEATCRWCNHFCEEPVRHLSPCATSNHGPVIHSTDKIKLCEGDIVKVDKLASRESTSNQKSGVLPESPTTCSTLCSQAGPRHIHVVSTANGRNTEVTHSDFWKQHVAFTDPSQGGYDFVRLFDLCPARCWEKGHGADDTEAVFCVEDALHVPLVPMQDDNQTEGGRGFQYTSTAVGFDSRGRPRVAGHHFRCGIRHPFPDTINPHNSERLSIPDLVRDWPAAFEEIVHWQKHFFKVPAGSVGKEFVDLLSKQLRDFVDSRGTHTTALYNLAVLPCLLLQTARSGSSAKDNADHLQHRLSLWTNGNIASLLEEGRKLQLEIAASRLGRNHGEETIQNRHFSDLVSQSRVREALRCLSPGQGNTSDVLKIDDVVTLQDGTLVSVREILLEIFPKSQPASPETLLTTEPPHNEISCFAGLTPDLLKSLVLRSEGSAGPSGQDSACWRRLCSAYQGASKRLCKALADFAFLLATEVLVSGNLAPFLCCRLIALDRKPGVTTISVCEVPRRIVAQAILHVLAPNMAEACGFLQKCSGLPAGIESAVHAMQELYQDESTDGALLVDVANAVNFLNRSAALHNIQRLCPPLAIALLNSYQSPCRLFMSTAGEMLSEEGAIQGDPLSVAFCVLATLPIVQHLHSVHKTLRQVWHAGNSGCAGQLLELRQWWEDLQVIGRHYGYFPNPSTVKLLVKPGQAEEANQVFEGTGVHIVSDGTQYLGSAIGEPEFIRSFIQVKVAAWQADLNQLVGIAQSEPQAVLAALRHYLRRQWTFILRTIAVPTDLLVPLDRLLVDKLLPILTNHGGFTEEELRLVRLPIRLGGMGFPSLCSIAASEFSASTAVTVDQVNEIIQQNVPTWQSKTAAVISDSASKVKHSISLQRREEQAAHYDQLRKDCTPDFRHRLHAAASEDMAWLTVPPLAKLGLRLSKTDFWDALALRYTWLPSEVPAFCVCGESYTIDHAMGCPESRVPTIQRILARGSRGLLRRRR